ncbi:unnamed protein product [Angiostrongylus costaricensis]|uniref:Rap-GAP domain-containing protein n=1 Tax=Angiostrongylus costaricensis TaxID=334426 RepID=A0A158PIW4_ANGCS|nr:unnamed protein product [Angiostrongylus costaricensis]
MCVSKRDSARSFFIHLLCAYVTNGKGRFAVHIRSVTNSISSQVDQPFRSQRVGELVADLLTSFFFYKYYATENLLKLLLDGIQVIAKGTSESRVAAANLLLHYWPFPNPRIIHRKIIQYKVHAWQRITCQSTTCTEKGPSVKSCFDPVICADIADTSPPVFLCRKCADNVVAERKAPMRHLTQPMQASSATCQNKDCQSQSRLAVSICFSHDCTRTHNFVPIRLCQCETPHLVHRGSGCVWGQPVMWDTVEGIVKLMRETAQFEGTEGEGKRPKWLRQLEGGHSLGKEIDTMADERRMLSRFGVWMMAALCPPNQNADQKSISYIMYNVFQWFATTALLPNDSMGASLEQLKTDFVCDWINMAIRIHYEVFISALSPNTEDGGQHFEQTKEGLGRLLALMPYDVISIETWSRVMPKWLQLINEKCTEEQQHELKILLCKIFEPDLCPLPFETLQVFDFVSCRLGGSDYVELFNALQWLHLLSRLEISIPLNMLLENFSIALSGLSSMEIPQLEQNDLEDDDVSVHIVIIDILVLQVLNNFQSPLTEKLFECVSLLLSVPLRTTDHDCKNPELDGFADCSACQQAAFLHQMVMNMTENVSPKQEMAITAAEVGSDSNSPNQQQQQQQQQKNPPDDFVTTSVGRFRFSIDQLPPQLKMIHALLKNLECTEDPDVENFIMNTLKFLCLHCGSLTNARREHRGFLIWIQESMMVPKLWARLRSDFAQVGELASLLLLHCISFPSGEEAFWRAVHKDFTCPDWKTRFDAVGKAYVMGHVTKMAPVKGNKVVQTALSALFYHFVTSLHDPNPAVAQRAIIALRALPTQTLKMICFCFESQFDSCIIDRPIIVNTIRLLTTQLPDETMLTFDFFIQAIEEAATTRSIVKYLQEYNALKHQLTYQPLNLSRPYSRLREFVDEESNLCLLFNRVVDVENPERHTVYLVVSLFVSFLSNKNSTPTDEKANAKKQSLLFRHFNTLIGFSNTEKCFTIPPARLRISVVCNAFLSGLPEILDCNLCIGNQLLPTVVQLLLHLPSPQKLASDQHQSNYSLKLLPQHSRHLWLNSFILILYKKTKIFKCKGDIVTWDDISEEESDSPKGMIRPESLTVTTIQVSVYFSYMFRKSVHLSVELRCDYCNECLTSFDEETISLCLIAVETFLHREPVMAAPILFSLLHTVTHLIDHPIYPWHDSEMFVPGNGRSVAKQMLRVTLHQLSSSGICMQLFDTPLSRMNSFWKVISLSLADFQELSPVYFIQLLFEDLSENWLPNLCTTMRNLAAYIVEVPSDTYLNHWSTAITHMESFLRRYHISSEGGTKPTRSEMESAIIVMSHVLKVQNFSTFKSAVSLVDSFCKWLAEALHECPVKLESLLTVCTACNRALIRERDKQSISRAVVAEMIQAIKFKCPMHERNFITIAHLILQDAGEDIDVDIPDDQFNTAASEAVRPFLFEILDFIADLHVLAKLKKETNSDTVGGDLKVKLAEAIAVEMNRSNARDCRTVIRFIPWLMSPPSVTQAAPGAFADSVTNVRVLSWLLLGALHANHGCLPVPIECSQQMADYIHFVLAGFADQSKQSVVHMSALFHAFHLCQLWTVYCERATVFSSTTAFDQLLDFWARVTPAILQLLSHSKVLADMVNLHFLNTIQALQQMNSALLCQLYPMWAPILTSYHSQVPNQLRIKLDSCENQPSLKPPPISEWLKKVRYKISQVELQTSAASPYYNV